MQINSEARLAQVINSNTRIFALSTHVYFMMSYLDPERDDFQKSPSIAFYYVVMITCASIMAILCFLVPKRRFTAWEMADELRKEATDAVSILLESMHLTVVNLVRRKAKSALIETEVVLSELEANLKASRFEDFAWGSRACAHNQERKQLGQFVLCLRNSIRHIQDVHSAAAALSLEDVKFLEQHVNTLGRSCTAAKQLINSYMQPSHPNVLENLGWEQLSGDLLDHNKQLSKNSQLPFYDVWCHLRHPKGSRTV